jgi:hypothetical protein
MDENVVVFTTVRVVTFGTTDCFCHLYNNEQTMYMTSYSLHYNELVYKH